MEQKEITRHDIEIKFSDDLSVVMKIPSKVYAYELEELTETVQKMKELIPNTSYEASSDASSTEKPKKKKSKAKKKKKKKSKTAHRKGEWSDKEDEIIFNNWDKKLSKSANFSNVASKLNRTISQTMQHVYYWKRNNPDRYKKLTGE